MMLPDGTVDAIAAILGILSVGIGVGWWIHPGAGLAAVGLAMTIVVAVAQFFRESK